MVSKEEVCLIRPDVNALFQQRRGIKDGRNKEHLEKGVFCFLTAHCFFVIIKTYDIKYDG